MSAPFTTGNGATYCCAHFADWMASGNEYHKSGLAWHDKGCEGFLPVARYEYGESEIMLTASSPTRAEVSIVHGLDVTPIVSWIPYHHATCLVAHMRWTLNQALREKRQYISGIATRASETANS